MTVKQYITPVFDFPYLPGFNNKAVTPRVEAFREDTHTALQLAINTWLTALLDPSAPRMAALLSIDYQATPNPPGIEYSALLSYYLIGEP